MARYIPKRTKIGSFTSGGDLVVSDPCYLTGDVEFEPMNTFQERRLEAWKQFGRDNIGSEPVEVLPGTYDVFLDRLDPTSEYPWSLNVRLVIKHQSFDKLDELWDHEFDLSTDAGLLGIYDADLAEKSFDYKKIIDDVNGIHLYDFGPVATSGEGDGTFGVFLSRNRDGDVQGVMVEFATFDDEEADE